MPTQDASAEIIYKFWPWLEANRKRLIIAAVVVTIAGIVWFFVVSQRRQAQLDAGQAYTQLQLTRQPDSTEQQVTASYSQIADKYPNTMAGQRAQLQAAALLFSGGHYADALVQFQNFLNTDGASSLAVVAQAGVAASLEAQNKLPDALAAYRVVTTRYPNSPEAVTAKFSEGRVLDLQGKLSEAVAAYREVTQSPLAGSMASEAGQRISVLQTKLAAVEPAAKPTAKPVAKPAAK